MIIKVKKHLKDIKTMTKVKFFSTKYFSILVGIVFLVVTLFAFKTIESNSLYTLAQNTEFVSIIYASETEEEHEKMVLIIENMAESSLLALKGNILDWDIQAKFYIDNLKSMDNIVLLDRNMKIVRMMPELNTEYTLGDSLSQYAIQENYLSILQPLYNEDKIEGMILADINVIALMSATSVELEHEYMIQVYNGKTLVYTSPNWFDEKNEFSVLGNIPFRDAAIYKYIISPTDEYMRYITRFSYQLLILGLLFSVSLTMAIIVAQNFDKKSKLLAKTQEHLLTHQKELEEKNAIMQGQLRDQQKLESIGTLASGVAHEINNPINGIMNYSQIIFDSSDKESENAEYAHEIIKETQRVSTLVKNLLQFSRHEKIMYSLARPEDIIADTVSLMNTIYKQDQIMLTMELADNLPNVRCHSQQIQQVLMNLMANARDALNDRYAGHDDNKKVILSCETVNKDDKKHLRIMVEDHGNGIPEDVQGRIFDQFFTTKETGKGTGLGLSISYGIVREHKGTLTFETKQGEYTRFYMDLLLEEDKKETS